MVAAMQFRDSSSVRQSTGRLNADANPWPGPCCAAKVLNARRGEVTLATKFGITAVDGKRVINGDPEYVKCAPTISL